jgi:hypothetical protein
MGLRERVTRLEVKVGEMARTFDQSLSRLDNVEKAVQGFTDAQTSARESERQQYERLGRRVAVLTLVIAVAAVVVPLVATYLQHAH